MEKEEKKSPSWTLSSSEFTESIKITAETQDMQWYQLKKGVLYQLLTKPRLCDWCPSHPDVWKNCSRCKGLVKFIPHFLKCVERCVVILFQDDSFVCSACIEKEKKGRKGH